jgi:hypothetical protein
MRWCARAAGAVVIVTWLELVLYEWMRYGPPDVRTPDQLYQAAALVAVFAGYLLGWRNELAGGLLSISGTIAFGAAHVMTFGQLPTVAVTWFALPGLLYMLAWYIDHRHGKLVL